MLEPVNLIRHVPADYLGAVQGIAALEQRIAELRSWPGDFRDEQDAARRLLASLRAAFGVNEMSEDEIDAAHEQAVAELDARRLADPDVPRAFGYTSRFDEFQTRGA